MTRIEKLPVQTPKKDPNVEAANRYAEDLRKWKATGENPDEKPVNLGIGVATDKDGNPILFEAWEKALERVRLGDVRGAITEVLSVEGASEAKIEEQIQAVYNVMDTKREGSTERETMSKYLKKDAPQINPILTRLLEVIYGKETAENNELVIPFSDENSVLNPASGGTGSLSQALLAYSTAFSEENEDEYGRVVSSGVAVNVADTWGNHKNIAKLAGLGYAPVDMVSFTKEGVSFDWNTFDAKLEEITNKGLVPIIIEQNGPQNPTGVVMTEEQCDKKLEIIKKYEALVIFDNPYQGKGLQGEEVSISDEELEKELKGKEWRLFKKEDGSWDIEKYKRYKQAENHMDRDAYMIRKAKEMGIDHLTAWSGSKTLSLYDQRIGAVVASLSEEAMKKFAPILNGMYRGTESFASGRFLALGELMSNDELWALALSEYSEKILEQLADNRSLFANILEESTDKDIQALAQTVKSTGGMFATLPLSKEGFENLTENHIHTVEVEKVSAFNGVSGIRVNLLGVTEENKEKVFRLLADSLEEGKPANCSLYEGEKTEVA
jgi:aspartate/tyrosine/aromatic aminotransferase